MKCIICSEKVSCGSKKCWKCYIKFRQVKENNPSFGHYKYNITKKYLIQEYVKNNKSAQQIAKKLRCSITPIYNRLKKYNIPIKTLSEARIGKYTGNKTHFYIDGRSSKIYYCTKPNCNNVVSGKNRKCKSCVAKTRVGKKAPNYIDGKYETYPFEFNNELKAKIRKRDNYTCQKCGKRQFELKEFHKKLTIHHIDYNRQNCEENNLITLCRKCNCKANKNRDYWFAYFKYIIENKRRK